MNPTTKAALITTFVCLTIGFAIGRWLAPYKTVTVVQTVTVEKKTDDKTSDDKKNTTTVVHEVKKPDGTDDITTTVVVSDHKQQNDTSIDDIAKSVTDTTTVTRSSSLVTISALGGAQISAPSGINPLVYGVSLTKPVLGPITVGVWGLNNSTIGASVGLTF